MRVKGILVIVAIISASAGLVGAANMWPVLQSAKAAVCQEFITGGVTTQKCSSDSSHVHANANNNNAHFKNLK